MKKLRQHPKVRTTTNPRQSSRGSPGTKPPGQGLLIFGAELYMQFLEGPVQELDETFNRIKRDNRHADIRILRVNLTDRRLFGSWKMRPQDLEHMHWSKEDIKNGLVDKLEPDQALEVFVQLSRDLDQFLDPESVS